MNISVYYGRAGSGKTRAVYERIRQVMTDCPGEPIILLVPEPATYRVERELAEFMPEKGFTTVRVVGFGRLGYQVHFSEQAVSSRQVQPWQESMPAQIIHAGCLRHRQMRLYASVPV